MLDHTLRVITGPQGGVPRAEGVLLYAPAGDGGLLIYFGGVEQPFGNDTVAPLPMSVSVLIGSSLLLLTLIEHLLLRYRQQSMV